jgi:hypothetical protein
MCPKWLIIFLGSMAFALLGQVWVYNTRAKPSWQRFPIYSDDNVLHMNPEHFQEFYICILHLPLPFTILLF